VRRRRLLCALAALPLLAPPLDAHAAEGSDVADAEPAPDRIPPGAVVWHPWSLFDPHLAPRESVLTGGELWQRGSTGAGPTATGFELSFGRAIATRQSPFFVRLQMDYGFRVNDSQEWVLSLPRYTYAAGLVVGPLEVNARAGTAVAEVHFGSSGFGLGFFSPIVGAGVSGRIGLVRLGAVALSEYAWRWYGGPSSRVQEILLEFSFGGRPDGLPSFYRLGR
jgi:hypothetical protein